MFGQHGDVILPVIDLAWRIDERTARALLAAEHPRAGEVYQTAWDQRLEHHPVPTPAPDGFSRSTTPIGMPGSPIGTCPLLISGGVRESARRAWGEAAEYLEHDEPVLAEPWTSAVFSLLHAAFALGAPDHVEEPEVLLQAWRTVHRDGDVPAFTNTQ
ncbi:hypothetical protein ACFSC4_01795 [Deinococcus malanensis]|uniref:hypothetical protein n=1 Tax=Deinococcus malanensis TaxID=1706855 RepID=UPI003631E8E6